MFVSRYKDCGNEIMNMNGTAKMYRMNIQPMASGLSFL